MSRRIGTNCCGSPRRSAPAPSLLRQCCAACPPIRDRTDWPSHYASWAASNAPFSCSTGCATSTCAGAPRRASTKAKPATRSPARSSSTRSEEHTSELQSLMRISYAVFCLKKKKQKKQYKHNQTTKDTYTNRLTKTQISYIQQ